PGHAAANLDALLQDLAAGCQHSPYLIGIPLIKQQDWMDVAVTSMEDIADADLVFLADPANRTENVRQLGPRHHAVLGTVTIGQPADGTKRLLARFPQQLPIRIAVGPADLAGVVLFGNGLDALHVSTQPGSQAVHFHDQHRAGIQGETKVKRCLHGLQDQVVEHLQRCRYDPSTNQVTDRVGGIIDGLEDPEERPVRFGIARYPHPYLGGDAEGALAADQDAGQIEAGIVLRRASRVYHLAIGQDKLQTEDMVDRNAVL